MDGYPAITADNWIGGIDYMDGASESKNKAPVPVFNAPPITEQTAEGAYPLVVADAGASLARDLIDSRIANEVLSGTVTYGNKGLIDSPADPHAM
mgnify:FL=1